MGGWRGGSEKNENNAILNSVEVVVEFEVELGKKVLIFTLLFKMKKYGNVSAYRPKMSHLLFAEITSSYVIS